MVFGSLRNQVTIVGSLHDKPLVTVFESGAMVARFSMGLEKAATGRPTGREQAFSMFAWGTTAEFINRHFSAGRKIAVTGRLVNRTHVGPKGKPQKITEVEVRQVVLLES